MPKHIYLLIILALALSQIGTFATASNSSDWTTFHHDASRSGYTTANGNTNAVKLSWSFGTNAAIVSSPAVFNGLVVVGCKDCNVYCVNASSGALVWKLPVGNEADSSPAIDNGSVYIGCDDGNLYCINISTGKLLWISEVGGKVRSSPVVVDGRVYVGSGEHDLFCLNSSNGGILWKFPTALRIESSPAVVDGVVYFASVDFFTYALNASTGEQLWRHHTGTDQSSPCIYNGVVYVGSYDGYVVAFNASGGDEMWRYLTQNSVIICPTAADGCIYVGSEDNSIYCFNASTGKVIWQTHTGYWVCSSATLADGNLYVGSQDYSLYCLNTSTGQIKWAYPTKSIVDSSPAIVNDTLYVGSSDYHLYAFTLYNATEQPLVANPAVLTVTSWRTFAFDDISLAVGAVVLFVVARHFYKEHRQNQQKTPKVPNDRQTWYLEHLNLICALTILLFAVACLLSLTSGPLWAADEKTYSQMAYHMVKSGDYLLPWAYGEPAIWAGKPPLLMWFMSLAYQVFGVNNFASRVWSVLFGVLSLVVVFYLGKKLYSKQVGFWSVVVLGTFLTFFAFATHAMTDGPMLFFMLASIYFVLVSVKKTGDKRFTILGGLFFGLALMTKQIEALLIPLIIVAYFLVSKRSIRFLLTRRFALFLAVATLIFLPYVLYMGANFKDFWDCYFIYSDVSRVVTPLEGHGGDVLFYFNYLATRENLLWVSLLPFAVGLCSYRAFKKRSSADVLLLVWIAVVLVLFTVAQTKLYWYILPALPAFAIAISCLLVALWGKLKESHPQEQLAPKRLS